MVGQPLMPAAATVKMMLLGLIFFSEADKDSGI
jgi:hypothetical protein